MKPTHDQIRKIMEAAVRAPSGDNCQPWRIQRGDGHALLEIQLDVERDLSAYNIRQTLSLFALGAAVVNAQVTAEALTGRTFRWSFENGDMGQSAGRVCGWLSGPEAPKVSVELARAVWRRQTDRRPFASGPLRSEEREALAEAVASLRFYLPGVRSQIMESQASRGKLSALIRDADALLWETPSFRNYMLAQIRPNSMPPPSDGMPENVLGLNCVERAWFRACRFSTTWAAITAVCGCGRLLAAHNVRLNRTAAAFLLVSAASAAPGDIVAAGAATQRLWLTLTTAGLAAQPMCSPVIHALRLRFDGLNAYSPRQVRKIRANTAKFFTLISEPTVALPLMVLRIGRPSLPIGVGTGRRLLTEVWRSFTVEIQQPTEQLVHGAALLISDRATMGLEELRRIV